MSENNLQDSNEKLTLWQNLLPPQIIINRIEI